MIVAQPEQRIERRIEAGTLEKLAAVHAHTVGELQVVGAALVVYGVRIVARASSM